MMEKQAKPVDFASKKPVLVGYGKYGAAQNAAMDEAMLILAERTKKIFIRFCDYNGPALVYASSDHADAIRRDNLNGVEVTRRESGGDPIYLDGKTFSYSIAGGFEDDIVIDLDRKTKIDKYFGGKIVDSIRFMVADPSRVTAGEHHRIDIDGEPVAGHALKTPLRAFLYEGVVAIERWDAEEIRKLIRLSDDDYERLKRLPNIKENAKLKDQTVEQLKGLFMDQVIFRVCGRDVEHITHSDMEEILKISRGLIVEKYGNPEWVYKTDDKLNKMPRFCLLYYPRSGKT